MTPLKEWLAKVQSADEQDPAELKERVVAVLREIYDPEIPVNIYDLGLIYGIECGPDGVVDIHMTLTSPGCPAGDQIVGDIKQRLLEKEEIQEVDVEIVWEPKWDPSTMASEECKEELGIW